MSTWLAMAQARSRSGQLTNTFTISGTATDSIKPWRCGVEAEIVPGRTFHPSEADEFAGKAMAELAENAMTTASPT